MRRRKSSFIHGTEDDVRELGAHLVAYLRRVPLGELPPTATATPSGGTPHRHVDSINLKSHFH